MCLQAFNPCSTVYWCVAHAAFIGSFHRLYSPYIFVYKCSYSYSYIWGLSGSKTCTLFGRSVCFMHLECSLFVCLFLLPIMYVDSRYEAAHVTTPPLAALSPPVTSHHAVSFKQSWQVCWHCVSDRRGEDRRVSFMPGLTLCSCFMPELFHFYQTSRGYFLCLCDAFKYWANHMLPLCAPPQKKKPAPSPPLFKACLGFFFYLLCLFLRYDNLITSTLRVGFWRP